MNIHKFDVKKLEKLNNPQRLHTKITNGRFTKLNK